MPQVPRVEGTTINGSVGYVTRLCDSVKRGCGLPFLILFEGLGRRFFCLMRVACRVAVTAQWLRR